MNQYFNTLTQCKLFTGIAPTDIQKVLDCLGAVVKTYDKGNIIFHEGDTTTQFAIVLSGSVQIVNTNYISGTESIVSTITQGRTFGEVFACAEVPLPVSAICSEQCQVLMIDCKRLTSSCHNSCQFHNQLIFNLVKAIASNNLLLQQKIEVTSRRTTRDKLLTYLYSCAKQQHSNSITIPYDRQQLADYLNVDRSGLSAEISKLSKENILSYRKNKFVLRKIAD